MSERTTRKERRQAAREGKHEQKQAEQADRTEGTEAPKRPRSKRRIVWEYVKSIGSALLIALCIRQFVFQGFHIPTGSMERTLLVGDVLFANKFLYGARTPARIRIPLLNWTIVDNLPVLKLPAIREPRQGDIIVFEYPQDRNLDYIKRCVAVAGDVVEVREGILHVNGEVYESALNRRDADHSCVPDWREAGECPEPHTYHDPDPRKRALPLNQQWGPYTVPPGHIFMMGDNRFNSLDSRAWGPLDTDLIKGKATVLYWSWDKDRMLPRLGRIGRLVR
jgi:signal peptidase I